MMKNRPPAWVVSLLLAMGVLSASACAQTATSGPTPPTMSHAVAPTTDARTTQPQRTATWTTKTPATFAIIGDYGMDNDSEAAVANLVKSWNPAYIVTVGDDYYATAGGAGTAKYDEATDAYFPAMGNHDYTDAGPSPDTYLTYFDLPGKGFINTSGNERFYDFVQGPIHFFMIDSDPV